MQRQSQPIVQGPGVPIQLVSDHHTWKLAMAQSFGALPPKPQKEYEVITLSSDDEDDNMENKGAQCSSANHHGTMSAQTKPQEPKKQEIIRIGDKEVIRSIFNGEVHLRPAGRRVPRRAKHPKGPSMRELREQIEKEIKAEQEAERLRKRQDYEEYRKRAAKRMREEGPEDQTCNPHIKRGKNS